jgi:hypothetical protein
MNRWFPIGLTVLAAMTGALLGCGGSGQVSSPTQVAVTPTGVADDGAVTQSGVEKVTICHIPPGNPGNAHTITVGEPAVAAHVAEHGDTIGPCSETMAHLVVIKHVINDDGGSAAAGDFTITVSGVTVVGGNAFPGAEAPGTNTALSSVGDYSVEETDLADYQATYSADCSGTIALGETKTCTVTNDDMGH